jgi:cytochrome P450
MRSAPMPPGDPFLGHARVLAAAPLRTLVRWMREHGPVVRFRIGRREGHVVYSADAIRQVLSDPDHIYGKDTHGYRTLRLFVGDGLLTSEGTTWVRQRRILSPAFHRQRVAAYMGSMIEVATESAARLVSRDGVVRMDELAMRVTLDILGRTLYAPCSVPAS